MHLWDQHLPPNTYSCIITYFYYFVKSFPEKVHIYPRILTILGKKCKKTQLFGGNLPTFNLFISKNKTFYTFLFTFLKFFAIIYLLYMCQLVYKVYEVKKKVCMKGYLHET